MTAIDIEKARKAAEAAAAKLAEAEAAEAEKAAQKAAERAEQQLELDAKFLGDWRGLESKIRKTVTPDEKADALESGSLVLLLADYLARRDAIQSIRSHAQNCAQRLGEDHNSITDVRYVDPVEELRRWQEDALYTLNRRKADFLSAETLAAYEVD
jgi:undecaprenyl pyrophosphate synthase